MLAYPTYLGGNHLPAASLLANEEYFVHLCEASEDCRTLLQASYFEARGESDKGIAAVMHIVLNRAAHPTRWGNTPKDVLAEKYQFSYIHNGSMGKGFTEKKQYRRIALIAKRVLDGEVEDPTKGATFFHTKDIAPDWAEKMRRKAVIGNHFFY